MVDAQDEIRRALLLVVAAEGQRAVADALGVSQPTVSRLLSGQQGLTLAVAGRLSRAYPSLRELVDRVIHGEDAGAPVAAS